MLCPASKQVVIQGSVQCPEMLAAGDLVVGLHQHAKRKGGTIWDYSADYSVAATAADDVVGR